MSYLSPIVAAAIVDSLTRPSHIFVVARAYPDELRGLFEFPGGKVEAHEMAEDALLREVREELGACVVLGEPVCREDGSWWPLANGREMGVWFAEVTDGELRVGESHIEGRWMPLSSELLSLPWIPADRPIVEAVLSACSKIES